MKPKLSLTLLLSFIFGLLSSQVPQGFNYQAIARDAVSGNPITDPIDVKIAILAADASTVIREEQHSAVDPDEHGLFSLVIGQGDWVSGLANFSDIDWTVTPKYIRTSIYYDGGWKVLDPAQLWSVPYAHHSASSAQWIITGNDIYRAAGNVGIGTASPVSRLHVKSNAAAVSLEGTDHAYIGWYPVTYTSGRRAWMGFGAAGTSVFSIVNENASGGHISILPGTAGKVGIGTAIPAGRLTVQTPAGWDDNTPLFEVKNKYGIPVLAVYNNGVKINIEHDPDGGKGPKGGFAIGGYDYTKGGTVTLMNVTPDSIRFNINNDNTKGPKGGFAIGGFDFTKGDINEDFMYITPQVSDNGYFNVFTGYQSGYKTISPGIANAFYGYKSGFENTTGGVNTFIGNFSGLNNTTGTYNTAVGGLAGGSLYSGAHNVFVGSYAGYDDLNPTKHGTGSSNVFIGNFSGKSYTSGYDNIFIGTSSGRATTTGNNNVAIGDASLVDNIAGNANVAVGASAGYKSKGYNNVFLGNGAGYYEEGSHRLYIDNFAYSAANAFIYGEFDNHFLRFNATVEINQRLDVKSVIRATGVAVPSSGAGLELSYSGGVSYVESYDRSTSTTKPLCLSGSYVYPFTQINLGSETNRWNTVYCVSVSQSSDERLKKDISELEYGLASIMKLEPVTFMWKDQTDGDKHIGLLAQDVAEVIGEAVDIGDDEEKTMGINYSQLIPVLIKGMQEQQAQIEELKALIKELMEK